MSPIYDLSSEQDRLALALFQPNKEHRVSLIHMIRRRYGDEAAAKLRDQLRDLAREQAA